MEKTKTMKVNKSILEHFSILVENLKSRRSSIDFFKQQMGLHKYAYIITEFKNQRIFRSCYFSDELVDPKDLDRKNGLRCSEETLKKGKNSCRIVHVSELPTIELSQTDLLKIESIDITKLEDLTEYDNYSLLKIFACVSLNKNFEVSEFLGLQEKYVVKKIQNRELFVLIDKAHYIPISIMKAFKDDFGNFYRRSEPHFSSYFKESTFNYFAEACLQRKTKIISEDFLDLFQIEADEIF